MAEIFVKNTEIEDLLIIEMNRFDDNRGFFIEQYNKAIYEKNKIQSTFVQDNHSQSKKGVLRGLHYQRKHPQGKLIRVIRGMIFDVAVDLRKDSHTYKKYFGMILSEDIDCMLYIPEGFAHGFLALSDKTDVLYKVTSPYCANCDAGIVWNDPQLNINWPFEEFGIKFPNVSSKDSNLPSMSEIERL